MSNNPLSGRFFKWKSNWGDITYIKVRDAIYTKALREHYDVDREHVITLQGDGFGFEITEYYDAQNFWYDGWVDVEMPVDIFGCKFDRDNIHIKYKKGDCELTEITKDEFLKEYYRGIEETTKIIEERYSE